MNSATALMTDGTTRMNHHSRHGRWWVDPQTGLVNIDPWATSIDPQVYRASADARQLVQTVEAGALTWNRIPSKEAGR